MKTLSGIIGDFSGKVYRVVRFVSENVDSAAYRTMASRMRGETLFLSSPCFFLPGLGYHENPRHEKDSPNNGNKKMSKYILSYTFILCTVCSFQFTSAELTVRKNDETGQWLISENGKPVVQYNYETVPLPEGFLEKLTDGQIYAVARSNYIHPLFDLDGEPITMDWAVDHAHHRGIYWAWPEVGYKGELGDLHALQNVFARPAGNIKATKENDKVKLVAESVWKWKDTESIVHETTTIVVHPLDKTGRKIDLEFRFKGLADEVTLARRGTDAYGGLNIRMQPHVEQVIGASKNDSASQPAWVFASWKSPKSEGRTEFTVFEKADNPDYPGQLIQFPEINWFQPTFPKANTRYLLKKEETLTLRYRLWIHTDGFDDTARENAWKSFQNEKL